MTISEATLTMTGRPATIDPAALFLPPTEPIDITSLIASELHR